MRFFFGAGTIRRKTTNGVRSKNESLVDECTYLKAREKETDFCFVCFLHNRIIIKISFAV